MPKDCALPAQVPLERIGRAYADPTAEELAMPVVSIRAFDPVGSPTNRRRRPENTAATALKDGAEQETNDHENVCLAQDQEAAMPIVSSIQTFQVSALSETRKRTSSDATAPTVSKETTKSIKDERRMSVHSQVRVATSGDEEMAGQEGHRCEFVVCVDKDAGSFDYLGIETVGRDAHLLGSALRIEAIREGLVDEWNSQCYAEPVRVGDHIVQVNGHEGDVEQLYTMISYHRQLCLKVVRRWP